MCIWIFELCTKQGQYLSYGRSWIYNQGHVAGSIGVKLNSPPFMEGQQRLPAKEVKEGSTAFVRIRVERAIGRIKTFTILKIPYQHTLEFLVCVCAYLSNFKDQFLCLGRPHPWWRVMK